MNSIVWNQCHFLETLNKKTHVHYWYNVLRFNAKRKISIYSWKLELRPRHQEESAAPIWPPWSLGEVILRQSRHLKGIVMWWLQSNFPEFARNFRDVLYFPKPRYCSDISVEKQWNNCSVKFQSKNGWEIDTEMLVATAHQLILGTSGDFIWYYNTYNSNSSSRWTSII